MRHGHFTAADIKDLKIIERDDDKNIAREVIAVVSGYHFADCFAGSYCLRSYGLKEIYIKKIKQGYFDRDKSHEQEKRYPLEAVPPLFAAVSKIVEKKAAGHGGSRAGAGRKKSGKEIKQTRSIRMTDKEYAAVCKLLDDMRIHESK